MIALSLQFRISDYVTPIIAAKATSVLIALFLLPITQVSAGTINVGTSCTLNAAIAHANDPSQTSTCSGGESGADTIVLSADFTVKADPTTVTSRITIEGNGYTVAAVSYQHRLFYVGSGGHLTINNLTLVKGGTAGNGGAIYVDGGTLNINSSIVDDSAGGNGGGIYVNSGTVTITNSTVQSARQLISNGGGIYINSGTVTITNSTFTLNDVGYDGGGIYNKSGNLTITNSTFSGNQSGTQVSEGATDDGRGAAIFSSGTTTLTHVTVASNRTTVPTVASGVHIGSGTFKSYNSLIAGSSDGLDCAGTLAANIGNIIEDGSTGCNTSQAADFVLGLTSLTDDSLAPHRPLTSNSSAIDAADANHCEEFDQRGIRRAGQGSVCDVGAIEYISDSSLLNPPEPIPGNDDPGGPIPGGSRPDERHASGSDPSRHDQGESGPGGMTTTGSASSMAAATPSVSTCESMLPDSIVVFGITSGTQCQQLDAAGIGIQWVIDAGFIDAVDIWGYLSTGVEVCFRASGSLIFLDAATAPRSDSLLPAYSKDGMTCGRIDRPGSVVLVPGPAPAPLPPPAQNLQGCMVTTTDMLNFRATPGGEIIDILPFNATLTALSRVPGWFQVDYHGTVGWISADYVNPQGECG